MEIQKKWSDIKVSASYGDKKYTQQEFEQMVQDNFVAMKVNEKGEPQLIWTEKYVCPVLFEVFDDQLPVMIFKRNPL